MMQKNGRSIHAPSLLIGIIIGVLALAVLLYALPGSAAGKSPTSQGQTDVNQITLKIKGNWDQMVSGISWHATTVFASNSCVKFRSWFNGVAASFTNYLSLHGLHLPAMNISAGFCSSISSGSG